MRSSSASVVSILADTAAAEQAARPVLIRETGEILIQRVVRAAHEQKKGAGVIIHPSGIIATNAHTVHDASRITVKMQSGSIVPADVMAVDFSLDLVLLKISAPAIQSIIWGNSDDLRMNEPVFAIGNSDILKNTFIEGRISGALINTAEGQNPNNMLQIDFKVYPGDSGSPVFNRQGQFVGMISAGGALNGKPASFAISSNSIRNMLNQALSKA